MTAFDYMNVLGRLMLTVLTIYKLSQFRDHMITLERIGLGMMGGGSFLTIPIIIDQHNNPFNGWATSLLTVGAVIFIAGRTWRDRRHAKANEALIAQARDWAAHRGK